MNKFIKLNIYFFPLTLLLSSILKLPNKISIAIVLISLIYKKKNELIKYISGNKIKWIIIVIIIALISFLNDVLFSEVLLFLPLPIFFYIYKLSDSLDNNNLKKYYCISNLIFIFMIFVLKIIDISKSGFYEFINNGYWWNKIIYLNLVEPVYGHPLYISLFILVSIVFLVNQRVTNRWFTSKTQTIVLIIIQFLFILLLSVKIAFISLVILLIQYIIWMFKTGNLKGVVIISISAVLITYTLIKTLPGIEYRLKIDYQKIQNKELILDTESKFSERLAIWKSSVDLIKENPITGTSLRNIKSKDAIFNKVHLINSYTIKSKNSHNNYLEFGVRYGIIGLISLLTISIYLVYKGIKMNSFQIIALSSVFVLFSLTESFLVREQGVILTAMIIGIIYKEINDERSI